MPGHAGRHTGAQADNGCNASILLMFAMGMRQVQHLQTHLNVLRSCWRSALDLEQAGRQLASRHSMFHRISRSFCKKQELDSPVIVAMLVQLRVGRLKSQAFLGPCSATNK